MPLTNFKCPNNRIITVDECLAGCPDGRRCMTLPTLRKISEERPYQHPYHTTQLLEGTMSAFLKSTNNYTIDPQSKAFILIGQEHHRMLEVVAEIDEVDAEVKVLDDDTISSLDILEPDPDNEGCFILTDYKTWGSYKIAKTLGLEKIGKGKEAVFQFTKPFPTDLETELQLNHYKIKIEDSSNVKISKLQVQATARDGGLQVAMLRGIDRNITLIPIQILDPVFVSLYFNTKIEALNKALKEGHWETFCNDIESWDGDKCEKYCDVWSVCKRGVAARMGRME